MGLKGKRPSGKPKGKSVKANVTSKFSSTRKLSRMGKKVKKGKAGPSTEFVTRSWALKKLQISLKDFRRLCILKGIYPRVPNKPPKGADKVYYDIKDLAYLAHEPLLIKFREFKTFMRKVRNAAGRNQPAEARRRNEERPLILLDHLVKERYPRFIDALGDLDDALCMVHLFAALPSVGRITAEKTLNCQNLVSYWQYYVARTRSLRKLFVSVKGVYYQCEIMGETITWLVPHSFTQKLPSDVDFRVMITFLDFYEVLLKFVLFKLLSTLGVSYPPQVNAVLRDGGGYLLAVNNKSTLITSTSKATNESSNSKKKLEKEKIQKLEAKLSLLAQEEKGEEEEEEDTVDIAGPLTEVFAGFEETLSEVVTMKSQNETDVDGIDAKDREVFRDSAVALNDSTGNPNPSQQFNSNLFQGVYFFVSREVPLDVLQMCILSFGGLLGWDSDNDASPFKRDDYRITHMIVDRPIQSDDIQSNREYIQPQWVFDSINAQMLLPCHRYRIGSVLPPHLSPFVDDDKEGYLPIYREEIKKLKSSVEIRDGSQQSKSNDNDESEDEEEDEAAQYARELEAEKSGVSFSAQQQEELEESQEEGEDEDESEEEGEDEDGSGDEEVEKDNDKEQEDETPVLEKKGPKGIVYNPSTKKQSQENEEANLPHIMMSKKTKRLYGRMQHGLQKKKESVDRLVEKRKAIEEAEKPKHKSSKKLKNK